MGHSASLEEIEAPEIEVDEVPMLFADAPTQAYELLGNIRATFFRYERVGSVLWRRPIAHIIKPVASWVPIPELLRLYQQRNGRLNS